MRSYNNTLVYLRMLTIELIERLDLTVEQGYTPSSVANLALKNALKSDTASREMAQEILATTEQLTLTTALTKIGA